MSMKNWMKAGLLSATLGLTAATGASAQESEEPKGEKTEIVQQQDYSKIAADRFEVIADGKTINASHVQRILPRTNIENAEDVLDMNTRLQTMLEQNNRVLQRILSVNGVTASDSTEITVNAYKGDEQVASFDADDVPEAGSTPDAAPPTKTRGGIPTRGQSYDPN